MKEWYVLYASLYHTITIGPHKCAKICWLSQNTSDSECFDAANQQIWVHLWGPGVMGVYHIMIIRKILRKCILIDRICNNHLCQIIRWWQLKEPLCCAWFVCSPSGYTPSKDYGISMCNSNDVMCSAEGPFPSGSSLETGTTTHKYNKTEIKAAFVPPSECW